MKTIRSSPWILLIAVLTVGLLALPLSARYAAERNGSRLDNADPNASTDIIMHDVGNVRFTIANYGEAGNPNEVPGFRGFEFPINSGTDFLFSAGIWVGAIKDGVMAVSTATDGDNGTGEFYPFHIGSVPFTNASADPDWHITSKNLAAFSDRYHVLGAKDIDDDGDWNEATDDLDGDGKPSKNWDGGKGFVNFDDDGDGLIDEEEADGVDNDGDGAIDEDTPAAFDDNHDGNCGYDPEPHIDEDPAGDISADFIDNDSDGLVDLEDPDLDGDAMPGFLDDDGDGLDDEDGVARGAQEYFAVFTDDIEAEYVSSPDPSSPHNPLQVQMLQRSYAFPEEYAADFILVDYRIRNVSPLTLRNVYIAMFSDPDIGAEGEGGDAASLDDYNYYDPDRLMMVQYDDPLDSDGEGPGVFAIRVVKTPVALDQLRVTFANFERVSGGDPETDGDKYTTINSGDISDPTEETGDWRMLMSFGAEETDGFQIGPGEELAITVAYIAGEDTADVGLNAEWALAMYLNDFQGPSAPDAPEFELDVYEDMVRIRWSPNAETSVDAITGEADFEGYIVERSLNQLEWETVAAFDRIDTLDGQFEWENFNRGMPPDTHWTSDTTFQYYVEDRDLIPGHSYFYTVRAFDTGVPGAGILNSSRSGNVQEAVIARSGEEVLSLDPSGIYVFPNPYKGSHRGEGAGREDPRTGLKQYPRMLRFMGLPGPCVIRIFSLGGDHLATINHTEMSEWDEWDLITKFDQEIVSGIYYFTVEYSGGYHIDKFVVIK